MLLFVNQIYGVIELTSKIAQLNLYNGKNLGIEFRINTWVQLLALTLTVWLWEHSIISVGFSFFMH